MTENAKFDFNRTLQQLSGDERTAQAAFDELYNQIAAGLYRSAMKFLKSSTAAEEVVQEVFVKIWEKRHDLKHVESFENYLHGIAKLESLNYIRRNRNVHILNLKHIERLEREHDPKKEECIQQISKVIEELPSPHKEIYQLAKLDGVKGQEIAERYDMKVDNVHYYLSKAKKLIIARKGDILTPLLLIASAL